MIFLLTNTFETDERLHKLGFTDGTFDLKHNRTFSSLHYSLSGWIIQVVGELTINNSQL